MTPTKVLVSPNTPVRWDRRRHVTQPDDRLVPTTVEIDDEGNPMFTYSEPTPRKLSPKIVAPQSLMNRLIIKGNRNSKLNKSINVDDTLSNRQPPQEQPGPVSLHHSLLDEPLDSSLLFEYEDDENENRSVHSVQSVQSTASSLAGSIAGSVKSLTRVKLRLRRNRKKRTKQKSKQDADINCTTLSPLKELETYKNKENEKKKSKKQNLFKRSLIRRSSNESSTRSTSSRASSLMDMDVPGPSSPLTRRVLVEGFQTVANQRGVDTSTYGKQGRSQLEKENSNVSVTPPVSVKVLTPSKLATTETLSPVPVTSPVSVKVLTPSKLEMRENPPPLAALKAATKGAATDIADMRLNRRLPTTILADDKLHRALESTAQQPNSKLDSRDSVTMPTEPSSKPSGVVDGTQANAPKNTNFKIYLLLLHPTSKIFELIQLFFDPSKTTIRDVMSMIPTNATELALGNQKYTGLCRPNSTKEDEEEISNLDLLVQNEDDARKSAKIKRREILVAIPAGYTGKQCVNLSQGILKNPRIRRLLEKNESKRRSSRREHRRRRRSSALKSVEVLSRHDEEKPTETEGNLVNSEAVQEAMEKAEKAAAVANAAVHELPRKKGLVMAVGKTYRYVDRHGKGPVNDVSLESALLSLDGSSMAASLTDVSDRSYSLQSFENSIDRTEYSMDKSLSSWSRSLDTSFGGSSFVRSAVNVNTSFAANTNQAPLMATPASRRRSKQIKLVRRVAVGVVVLMYSSYYFDSNGFASRHGRPDRILQQPMGLPGLIQVVFFFFTFAKLQFLCSIPSIQSVGCLKSRCPFVRSRASFLKSSTQTNTFA